MIRFANLDSRRIGHFASEVNTYLCELKKKKLQYDFFYAEKPVCNNALLKIYKRQIFILPEILISPFIFLNNNKFFGDKKHSIRLDQYQYAQLNNYKKKNNKLKQKKTKP